MNLKFDSEAIRDFMHRLPERLDLSGGKELWPRFLFHTTDRDNAVQILTCGELRSRNRLEEAGVKFRDCANSEIINLTSDEYKDSVRLYFRPRTPTHWHTEGYRPRTEVMNELPHMPTPIMFLFNSVKVMTQSDAIFTDGNAGGSFHNAGNDVTFLESIPFDLVYNDYRGDGPLPVSQAELTKLRNAEVCIKNQLNLANSLEWIFARSEADLDSLQYKLRQVDENLEKKYRQRMRHNTQTTEHRSLFHRNRPHISRVRVSKERISVGFHPGKGEVLLFDIRLQVKVLGAVRPHAQHFRDKPDGVWNLPIPAACRTSSFEISIWIDDTLAYTNRFLAMDVIMLK